MQDLTAHQRPDGMYLVPDNPYHERLYMGYGDISEEWKRFERENPPIPTDDKDLVEGQKVDRGDYEEVAQYYDSMTGWSLFSDPVFAWMKQNGGFRTILRKKSNLPSVQPIAESHIKPEFEGKELYMDGEWKQVEPIADKGESKSFLTVLEENYKATVDAYEYWHDEHSQIKNLAIQETYEDLIAIYKAKFI